MKFKYPAKLTQRIYGIRSQAATLEILVNTKIANTITAHKRTITANAPPMDCPPKKMGDQIAFKTNCIRNNRIAFFFSFESLFQISHNEIPINK